MTPLWPHQIEAIRLAHDALGLHRTVCLRMATGAGKSRVACELIRDWLVCGFKVSLYTNRRMLLDQLARTLTAFGLTHGRRSADAIEHGEMPTDDPLQISSIQTEASRTLKKKVWQLHNADRVVIDEAHLNKEDTAAHIIGLHLAKPGAAVLGLTATPLDIGGLYEHLICAGTMPELRSCGALVRADHFGCEEPDTRKLKKSVVELSEKQIQKLFKVQHIIGKVLEHYHRLNPEGKPSIGFAPGVKESIWFCEQFRAAGIRAAHIDGENVWLDGELHRSEADTRETVMRLWKRGEIKIVWNRFVLREGIDVPWVQHMIVATIFNSLQSYLQSVGRGLRASPSTKKAKLVIQDHGGHWWRFGSVNVDREWSLELTERMADAIHDEKMRNTPAEKQPCPCPKCGQVMMLGTCRACGFKWTTHSRRVIEEDGRIVEHVGAPHRPRPIRLAPNTRQLWERMYYRSLKTDRTFRAALGLFFYEEHYYPPPDMPFMPKDVWDMARKVKDVPRERLT